jgi:hypothetical protein
MLHGNKSGKTGKFLCGEAPAPLAGAAFAARSQKLRRTDFDCMMTGVTDGSA